MSTSYLTSGVIQMVKGSEDSYKAGYRIVLFHQVQMPFLDGVINLHTHKYLSKKSLSSVKRTKNNLCFFMSFVVGRYCLQYVATNTGEMLNFSGVIFL